MPRLTPSEITVALTENEANWLYEHLMLTDMSGSDRRFAGVVSRILTRLELPLLTDAKLVGAP